MRNILVFIGLLILFLAVGQCATSFAEDQPMTHLDRDSTTSVGMREQIFKNENCATTDSCSLKSVRFVARDYQIRIEGDIYYGTHLFASYQTDTVEHLNDYAFVQFIEGCACLSYFDHEQKKRVHLYLNYTPSNPHFGRSMPMYHPQSVIDSIDVDPMYRSSPGKNRHFNYYWAEIPGTMPAEPEHRFGKETPRFPELYITDFPYPGVTYDLGQRGERSYSSSLFFKVCVYKERDLPRILADSNLNFAKPLACFNWSNSYVWDIQRQSFVGPTSVASICKEARAVYTADMQPPPLIRKEQKQKKKPEIPRSPGNNR